MNEAETRAELIDPKLKAFMGELPSPEGAESDNDGYSPSYKKMTYITSPERAAY